MEQLGESRKQPPVVEEELPGPPWSDMPLRGHEWIEQIRERALHKFKGVRYVGAVVGLLFCSLVAMANTLSYLNTADRAPFYVWGWDLICGVVIALLWLWGGWRPFLWLRERCRAYIRRVLDETGLIVQLLSLETNPQQPPLWRLVLGPVAASNAGKQHAFHEQIWAFLRHYHKFANMVKRAPFPIYFVLVETIVQILGGAAVLLGIILAYGLLADLHIIREQIRESGEAIRLYFGVGAVAVCGLLALRTLADLRRASIELAVTDILLGDEV